MQRVFKRETLDDFLSSLPFHYMLPSNLIIEELTPTLLEMVTAFE